ADRNRSHWSTSKTPSYTKSVSWQHHPYFPSFRAGLLNASLQIHRSIARNIFKGKLLFFLKH
ncbi:hypothetical protein POV15_17140, partial [Escherichia coli]|uniref:hypothetical protein n=1 Tax=Escherichia coli TaxID=562 RepID=UPI0019632D2A